jgi:hypothetical protein
VFTSFQCARIRRDRVGRRLPGIVAPTANALPRARMHRVHRKPTFDEMEEIALVLDRVALKRDAGFVRLAEAENSREKIELILDENSQ